MKVKQRKKIIDRAHAIKLSLQYQLVQLSPSILAELADRGQQLNRKMQRLMRNMATMALYGTSE